MLVRKDYDVIIVARHSPCDRDIFYTSPWAGAHYRPFPDMDPVDRLEADFAFATYPVFIELAQTDSSSSVKTFLGIEYFDDPSEDYADLRGRYSQVDGFRVLERNELPAGVKFGTRYNTWCLNPPVYLARLERQLVNLGVRIIRRHLTSIPEVFSIVNDPDIHTVVNCSGIGFSDPDVFPTRGTLGSNSRFNRTGQSVGVIVLSHANTPTVVGLTSFLAP